MTDDATLSDFGVETGEDSDADSSGGPDADSNVDDGTGDSSTDDTAGESNADATAGDSREDQTAGSDADPQAAGAAIERSDGAEPHAHTSLSTYAWGEYTCSRCGDDGDRVWRDDGAFVCPDCKEW